jgi:MoaA/NifB/PqqE/SkfB family radical SAM enzyme
MLTNVIHRWNDIARIQAGEKVFPHFVDFHTSDRCNHKCSGCAYIERHSDEMITKEKHFNAVDQFMDAGVKAFDFAGGGEPTLLWYLPELMEHIANRGGYFGLITNGSKLNRKLVNILVARGTYLRVSLEGSSPWQWSRYKNMPAPNFGEIIDATKEVISLRDELGSTLQVGIKYAVGRTLRGSQHCQMMFTVADYIQPDRVTIKCLTGEPEELSSSERYAEYALFMKSRPVDTRYKIIEAILPIQEYAPQCYLNQLHTMMDQRGDIWMCCYGYVHGENHKIGNIFETPFKDLWMSPRHRQKVFDIDRRKCATVDCKFFSHHQAIGESTTGGQIYFL